MTTATAKQNAYEETGSIPGGTRRRWLLLLSPLLAVPVLVFGLGFWPVPQDLTGDEETVGARPGTSGLNLFFPAISLHPDNLMASETDQARAELGRLLFFDPIMSGGNDISCATCHHPDLGLSDGRAFSMGAGGHGIGPSRTEGALLRRSAPSLWNVAYNTRQLWDGRMASLEEQAISPITNELEMGEKPEVLMGELKAIPEYAERFDAGFGGRNGSGITLENVARAIAAFERTLTANNTPFDRFVRGERSALTTQQLKGFNIFRSGKTRCVECHVLPTFANTDFKVIAAPDSYDQPDYGRLEITKNESDRYAFKVPTLRNAVLSAPYMHNGSFDTVGDVIDFYTGGGGPTAQLRVDDKIHAYLLGPDQKAALIAFLYALTDESKVPQFPDRVPSGLPVVGRLDNAARKLVVKYNTGSTFERKEDRRPQTLRVKPGESIQGAIDRATPGDTIEVMPGAYNEEVTIDLDNITLRGVPKVQAEPREETTPQFAFGDWDGSMRPLLDGQKKLSDAVIVSGEDCKIEGFDVRNYSGAGVAAQNAQAVVFRDLRIEKVGLFGVYAVNCTGVTIARVSVTGVPDAGIRVGQSRDIIVKNCEVHLNVVGIEIENSVNALVESNYVQENTAGILVYLLPNSESKVARDCRLIRNRVLNNNLENYGNLYSFAHTVQPGTGILVLAADNSEITSNEIRGNNSYGVAVLNLSMLFPSSTVFDVGQIPENTWVHNNTYSENGRKPALLLLNNGVKGADLVWDRSGHSNRWEERNATRSTPLLDARWPDFMRRAFWRVLTIANEHS